MALPRIAVTMGDPAGIGPEICLKLLADVRCAEQCRLVLLGDAAVLQRVAQHLGWPRPELPVLSLAQWPAAADDVAGPVVVDLGVVDMQRLQPGRADAATGRASLQYIEQAVRAALEGSVQGVATGPVNKRALWDAGCDYPGHSELLAERTGARRSCMMLTSDEITCSFVTAHVGYCGVPPLLTQQRLLDVMELSHEAMRRIRGRAPRLVTCGLNPHAGESGLFGAGEEERIIAPAIEAARRQGIDIEGPLPPDTAFLAARRKRTDCYVCMYHDQGHIPLKALAFERAVNITLGLPIVRTSVDHGTALDIAWQGQADATSLIEAVRLAARLAV